MIIFFLLTHILCVILPFLHFSIMQSIRLSGGINLLFHLANIGKCHRAFGQLIGSSSYRAMVIVGKMEDQGKKKEFSPDLHVNENYF